MSQAGTAVIVGIPEPDEQLFQASIPRRKELTVQFSRRSRDTLEDGVALAAANQIHLEQYPTRQFTLDQAAEAMQAAIEKQGDMIRAIVTP